MRFLGDYLWRGILRDEAAADAGNGGGGSDPAADPAAAPPDPVAAMQAKLDELTKQVNEGQQAAQYWHDEYKKKEKPADKVADKSAATADEPAAIDPIELLAKEGEKGLDKLLERRGYVKRSDLDRSISTARTAVTEEAMLVKEYPELNDPKSDFFIKTGENYRAMVARGIPANEATRLAAEKTDLELIKSGKKMTPADREEREARADAAGGDKTRKGGKGTSEAANDDKLDSVQEQICREMCPDGVDLKKFTENYIARAKKGVIYTGAKI